ncbi:FACT complex [Salix suchowensis]|nr:FACT complex [Salix suchowensis]
MIFNLGLGFSDLVSESGQKYVLIRGKRGRSCLPLPSRYSIQLVDTVKIEAEKASLLTEGVKSTKDTMFFLNPESADEKPKKPEKKAPAVSRKNGSPRRRRLLVKSFGITAVTMRPMSYTDNFRPRAWRSTRRRRRASGKEGKGWKKFQSYKAKVLSHLTWTVYGYAVSKSPDCEPPFTPLSDHRGQESPDGDPPIHGFAVPFHINTIKNVSKNDEGDYTYLRINFQTPGQLAGKKEDTPFENPDATFVRSISYRSPDGHRFDNISKQITELKKEANKREQQKKELADVVEQANLVELKGRRPAKLPEVFVRPAPDGKRIPGEVEIHSNGIRYHSPLGQKIGRSLLGMPLRFPSYPYRYIDVLFTNIKHLFFQPCDKELIVVVHMHLKSPIIIGKKKSFVRRSLYQLGVNLN